MKKSTKVAAFLLLGAAVVTGGIWTSNTYASVNEEKEVKETVQIYLEALENGDASTMAKYTIDERFDNDEKKLKVYESAATEKMDIDMDSVSVEKIEDEKMSVTFHYTNRHASEDITLPVVKENDQWKVVIENTR
ncbi:DUF4878 domain-containing protein [Brevibacillus sp. HB1.3]|uniref:Rv0361 family membrane protein n=1 Tax=Brevibacillus sp. HB1.3 TaxID=2738842 RepID=UPI0015570259|nr:DUF4878 domain-containing protein [Brevibacillus sp. HB1.3]NQF17813.1 DUF4878 domain-containing protein [Brevibacillus sp. HB1.3]